MGSEQLYRKAALERLSSPEQLDRLLRVTSPMGWLSLAVCGVLLAGAVVWGIAGRIPEKVHGTGMLLKSGGVFEITAASTGTVKDVYFRAGDIVKRGQIVARIDHHELVERIRTTKASLSDLEKEREEILTLGAKQSRLEAAYVDQQKQTIENRIRNHEKQIEWLKVRIASHEKLYEDGLITKEALVATRQSLDDAQHNLSEARDEIERLALQAEKYAAEKKRELTKTDLEIASAKRGLEMQQNELDAAARISTPYSGRILEVSASEGTLLNKGQTLLRLELLGKNIKNLQAVLYFPPGEGKKIALGMKAQVAPATVEQSEYGYLLGIVTSVAEYPSTRQAMLQTLQNEGLVNTIAEGGAPIEAEVDLIPAPRNPSGYKWTSSRGPRITLATGTMCAGNVTILERRPVSMVIPLLKEALLGTGEPPPATAKK